MKKSKVLFLIIFLGTFFIFSSQVFAKPLSEYPKSTQLKIEACSGKGDGEKCLYYGSVKGICRSFDEYFFCESSEISGDNLGQLAACRGLNICDSCQFSGSFSGTCSYNYVSADYKRELYCYLKADGFTCMEDSDCSCFGSEKVCKPRNGYGGDCVSKKDIGKECFADKECLSGNCTYKTEDASDETCQKAGYVTPKGSDSGDASADEESASSDDEEEDDEEEDNEEEDDEEEGEESSATPAASNKSSTQKKSAIGSQCSGGQGDGQSQTGCTHDNDAKVLAQCKETYKDDYCASVQKYLDTLSNACKVDKRENPSGLKNIDCDMITSGGFYGREAAKYAAYNKIDKADDSDKKTTDPVAAKKNRCSSSTAADGSITFPNPLCYDSLSEVLVAILVNLQSFLALVAIIMIIIGGLMYMFSSGNETMITKAKTTIGGALIGLAIILAAPSFLKQIKDVLGGGATGANADEIVNNAYSFKDIAISVINFLLSTIGILGIIAMVIGGVMYVTAYGSEERIELAKKIIGSSLIGILIAFGALILVKQIAALLGAA